MNIIERYASAYAVYALTGDEGENIDNVISILEGARAKSKAPLLAFVFTLAEANKGKLKTKRVRKMVAKYLEVLPEKQ